MPQAADELAELVAIRSVADPRQFPPEECDRAAQWVLDHFAALGFTDARLARTSDGSNAVVGSRPCASADAPTVLLYAHYDVQPPLDEQAWRTPPFELTEKDGRVDVDAINQYARQFLALLHVPIWPQATDVAKVPRT